jgi:outer membrane protein|tara:strand:+ start:4484 stop:5839 length:1356 start_codon:yes stop_codon:yes gene_type:complete
MKNLLQLNKNIARLLSFLVILFSLNLAQAQVTTSAPLSLDDAIHRALQSNYGIRMVNLQTQASAINNSWGAAGALPNLSTSVSGSSAVSDQTQNPTSFIQDKFESDGISTGVNFNWTLFNGMGMFASKSRLALIESQSEGQATLIIEQTVEAVDRAYHSVLLQTELLSVLAESMSLSRQRLNEIKLNESYGIAGTFDRLQFENAILADSTSWLQQGVALKSSVRNLNLLMGDVESHMWTLTDELTPPPALPSHLDVRIAVLLDNTSVQNAIISENIARQGVKQAQSFLYPVLGFNASFSDAISKFSAGEDNVSGRSTNTSALLTMNFNLFNGGATRRAISIAQIQADIAAIDSDNVRYQAAAISRNAYDRNTLGESVYNLSVKASENASISLDIAESSYKNGVINALDYRALEIALQRARVNELSSLLQWRSAYVEVNRLMGALRAPLMEE